MKATAFLPLILITLTSSLVSADSRYLAAALQAARWIQSAAVQNRDGMVWPSDPRDPETINSTLYSGTPGVVLFFLEAYRLTGKPTYLRQARAGADWLLLPLPREKEAGLYEGISGIGFTLMETYKATHNVKYRQGALTSVRMLRERAVKAGSGVQWNETTDIIGGSAGIGLFLLYASREFKNPQDRNLAVLAGRRLIQLGRSEGGGLKWAMDPGFPRLMPNFSHGTAGVCYFLATLYGEAGGEEFLNAALSGAKYLQSIANTQGDGCLIFHDEPDGRNLYYLGWCHGPVGTARLFYRLWQVSRDPIWMEWVKRSARSIMESGIPEKQTAGFWNNVSQCCGSAGVAEFFLNLYRFSGERQYLDFSKRVTADLLARATRESNGLKWVQAEHRITPDLLVAQTGYMQGAAGIGMLLLHLDALEQGKKPGIAFPDSPF